MGGSHLGEKQNSHQDYVDLWEDDFLVESQETGNRETGHQEMEKVLLENTEKVLDMKKEGLLKTR